MGALGVFALLSLWAFCPSHAAETGGLPSRVPRPLELEDWPTLLDELAGDPLTNATLRLVTVRGLFETGRLPEEMFCRLHQSGPDLLTTSGLEKYEGAAHLAETLLQIGYLNGAERLAFDSLEMEGESASALRTLVRLHVIRGLTDAAHIFLNRLEVYPEHRAWCASFRAALATDPLGGADPSLVRIRANLMTQDRIVSGLTTDRLLRLALEANPTNRMAFEYLAAHQLLARELLPFRSTMARSPWTREGALPRHFAEALLLHGLLYPGISLESLLPRVPPEVSASFERFLATMKGAVGSLEERQVQVWREFANTYWYYYFFGHLDPPGLARDSVPP